MNFTIADNLLGRQRSRQWTPLVTQQYRLRHVQQIFGLNFSHISRHESYYYTIHLTTMSAPFFTSESLNNTNPRWAELDQRNLTNLAATAVVLRVWHHTPNTPDDVISTWGINLSGLVYLGNKISEIQPAFFKPNTVIFNVRGGFFTCKELINQESGKPPPFCDNLNLMDVGGCMKIFKRTNVSTVKSELRSSYNINKLRKLHSLQVTIRNKSLDVENVRDKIEFECGTGGADIPSTPERAPDSSPSNVRYAPQLLTMKSVNKMLEQKPTKLQKKRMERIRNEIEIEQFKSKLLSQERDKKSALIRRFKNKLNDLVDDNEKKNSELMNDYYKLSREMEKLKVLKKNMGTHQELLMTLYSQLHHRQRQLLKELLFIYPIEQLSEKKYTLHSIYVPNSDILSDCSDIGISVAFGYITHILLMCSIFLQVPLRYPVVHYGSRSYIIDQVLPFSSDREREFPLFTKGKERIHFTYAVYLLNKNIAQLRWLFFMHTPRLEATLPNLLTFLEGKDCKETLPLMTVTLDSSIRSESENLRPEISEDRCLESPKKYKMYRSCESGPGLSEILAVPEAFMNKQISSDLFKSYAASKKLVGHSNAPIVIKGVVDENGKNCDSNEEAIEQGTDLLDPSVCLTDWDGGMKEEVDGAAQNGSFSKEDHHDDGERKLDEKRTEFLENWMTNETSSECCSNDESLVQTCENFSEITVNVLQSPLTARTEALRNTKSFNLVKPKPNL